MNLNAEALKKLNISAEDLHLIVADRGNALSRYGDSECLRGVNVHDSVDVRLCQKDLCVDRNLDRGLEIALILARLHIYNDHLIGDES